MKVKVKEEKKQDDELLLPKLEPNLISNIDVLEDNNNNNNNNNEDQVNTTKDNNNDAIRNAELTNLVEEQHGNSKISESKYEDDDSTKHNRNNDASALIENGKRVIYLKAEAANAFNEFVGILQEHIEEHSDLGVDEATRVTFNVFDEDGSGEIDVIELQHAMTDMGVGQDSEGNGGLSKTAAKELMKHIDTDGGGLIAYEQFKTALNTIAEIAV